MRNRDNRFAYPNILCEFPDASHKVQIPDWDVLLVQGCEKRDKQSLIHGYISDLLIEQTFHRVGHQTDNQQIPL